MTFKGYLPTFRNVLLEVIELTQTSGGIYIPSSDFIKNKEYRVMKKGKDCIEVVDNATARLMSGAHIEEIVLDGKTYYQVPEQQIIGYEANQDDSIRATPKRKPKATSRS